MTRIVVVNGISLDGVMQGPGRPEEDTRDGFELGGWNVPYSDEATVGAYGERFAHSRGFLFGRRTYEDILGYWNSVPANPFVEALNNTPKFVASNTLPDPPPWPNTTLLRGDARDAVAELRAQPGDDLHIMGSGVLIHDLMERGLVDEFLLTIAPVVLGQGHKLFDNTDLTRFELVESRTTSKGVVIAVYRTTSQSESADE